MWLLLLFFVVAICFVASLLPVFYPGTIVSMFGAPLNAAIGEFLATTLKAGKGSLVVVSAGTYGLTLEGVLAVYVPILLVLLLIFRGR